MRTLLVAAAVILSVTAAQAQEMVGEKPATTVGQGSADRAVPPVASQTIVDQLKAAGEIKDPKALEAPAPKLDAVEAKPAEIKPAEVKPVEAKPVEPQQVTAKPAETKPVDTKAFETKAVDTKAVETKPVATKPIEAKPVQAVTEAKPAPKRVAKKRETDEQKARRIAAKYGVSW